MKLVCMSERMMIVEAKMNTARDNKYNENYKAMLRW